VTGPARRTGYLRLPAITGEVIVFCAEDDLWTVPAAGGTASRLTACLSEASRPRLSPDGTTIAFTAADDGPTEIYSVPLGGGDAQRLTYQGARCVTAGWDPSTSDIVYASTAGLPAGFGSRLHAVSAEGGPPRLLPFGRADSACFGPDGTVVVGRNTADPARWKRYRGGCAGELWTADGAGEPFRPLLALPGNLASPCWAAGRVFFISDHEGTGNVYSCQPDGGGLRRHTSHADFYARNLSGDGQRLVYHAGARLYLLDTAGLRDTAGEAQSAAVPVCLPGARAQRGRRYVEAGEYLESAQLSPDGTELAVVCRGQAFTLAHWSGAVHSPGSARGVRYRLAQWLPNGRRLAAVAADERPDERLVLLTTDKPESQRQLTDGTHGCVTELAVSPASERVAFATSRQQLWTVDAGRPGSAPALLDASEFERIEDLTWSPDGRWLAYSFPNTPRTTAIKVADVVAGRTYQVTDPVLHDSRAAFDPGGRYLYFVGQRDLSPDLDQVQAGVGFTFGTRPYLITLRASDPSPFVERRQAPGRPPAVDPPEQLDGTGQPDGTPAVEIDLDGIERRVTAFPVPEGRYASVTGLAGKVLLLSVPVTAPDPESERDTGQDTAEGTVTLVDLATAQVTEDYLSRVDEVTADHDGTVLLYREDGRLRVLAAGEDVPDAAEDTQPGPRSGWVDLDRVQVPVRPADEWAQMFRESWRLQRESFWDAGMSGTDWDGLYQRYRPLADLLGSRAELSDLIWELQGELGTSHAYELGGDYRAAGQHQQGFLGADLEASSGPDDVRWTVGHVLHGDPWNSSATSPCNRPGADIRPGDAVVAVNGAAVGPAGPGEHLVGRAGQEVELTIERAGEARAVTIRAARDEARARYLDWTRRSREVVHAESAGRLGYLHVPDMFQSGYADFVRGFLAELDRDGLIVDVRFNGGGHISPLLLDRLARRRSGIEHGRWSGRAPYPAESPRGPMVLLVNEHTGSDGELFSHAFRCLGLGALVGVRTWGGTIAVWPRHRLVDGTVTTQPEFRYYLQQIGDKLENHGVEPDVTVLDPPSPSADGTDPQLATAVRYLLDELRGDEGTP
jgi:tricorn protease